MSTAPGTIVIQNSTEATGLQYWVGGEGSGAPMFCSGILGSTASGTPEVKCAVSGYNNYWVTVGPIGNSPATNAAVQAKIDQVVTLAVNIS